MKEKMIPILKMERERGSNNSAELPKNTYLKSGDYGLQLKSHTQTHSLHYSTLERGDRTKIVQVNIAQFYYSV